MGNAGKITRNTTIKVRLYPTPEQAARIEITFTACRWIWNAILADEREFYAATDRHYLPTPAKYKKEAPFLKEADSQALVTAHQNLRRAFQSFFDGRSGYPQFKPACSRNAYTVYCHHYERFPDSICVGDAGVKLPKLGWVKAELHRKPLHWWTLKSATVSRSRDRKYYCSVLFGYQEKPPEPVTPGSIGAAEPLIRPGYIRRAEEKLADMEQKLLRMRPGSRNHEEQLLRIGRQREHIANQKRDLAHKESSRLASQFDAVEAGETDARFREKLRYKLERQGKTLLD
ncbi:MAG: transposase [Oscillospiraceae bacterium]|nr:transposase [Oscillospiraceae bacterium]